MSQDLQWSRESYRLDKVKEIFGLPCVVRLEEGYMPPDESEEFAQGDIITLDTEVPSDKVGAYFIRVDENEGGVSNARGPDYGTITSDNQEIFLPYAYDGKLKVVKTITKVHTVKELANIFPGYAELGGKLSIKTNTGESVTLAKGTTLTLDRIIPGATYGSATESDKLVIQFEHSHETKIAAIPFTMKGKFHTKADNAKYTITEAIDRYGLPLDIRFLNDEIRQKFFREVLEGRRKLGTVTEFLRLTRIVKHGVLVGHYKPVMEPENEEAVVATDAINTDNPDADSAERTNSDNPDRGDVRRRTVVVIPTDSPEIGEIMVNICEGDVLTIYESLVNIQSVSDAKDMVRDTLCLDFEVKPGMKLLTSEDNARKYENVKHSRKSIPPPLPVRPKNPTSLTSAFEGRAFTEPHYKTLPTRKEANTDDYLVPSPKRVGLADYVDMTGPGKSNGANTTDPPLPPRKPKQIPPQTIGLPQRAAGKEKKHFWQKKKKSFKLENKEHLEQCPQIAEIKPRRRLPDPLDAIEEDDGLDGYEELKKIREDIESKVSGTFEQLPPSPHVGATVSSADRAGATDLSNDLGEYEEISGLKPPSTRAPEIPSDRSQEIAVLSGYDEIEDVLALHKEASKNISKECTESSALDSEKTSTPTELTKDKDGAPSEITVTAATQENTETLTTVSETACTESDQRSVANVSVTRHEEPKRSIKLFKDLTNEELVDRLLLCNLQEMAEICKSENLDGEFFNDSSTEFLRETMGLQGIKLAKFLKMRDENWVPK